MPTPRTLRLISTSVVTAAALAFTLAAPAGAASSSDKKIAKTGVIVAKDLPAKWDSTPADPESGDAVEALAADFPECDDYLDSRQQLKQATNAESRDFSSPDAEDLSNETWVFGSTAAARSAFTAMGASTNADCLTLLTQEAFQRQIAADPASAGQVTSLRAAVQETASVPKAGDDQLGYIGTVTLTLNDGSTQQLLIGYFAVRTSRGIIGYTIAAPPVDDSFSDSYASAVEKAVYASANRMKKALKK